MHCKKPLKRVIITEMTENEKINNKPTNNSNGKNTKKEEIDDSFEKNLDVYMYGCLNSDRESNDKAMYELAKKLGTEVESRYVDIDEPNELKIIYGLKNDGEMLYHKDGERDLIEIEISSPAPDPQANLFYMIHSFKPQKKSRAFCYHDSEEIISMPKYIAHNPLTIDVNSLREVALGYDFRAFGFSSSAGVVKFEKKENLEQKLEPKKEDEAKPEEAKPEEKESK